MIIPRRLPKRRPTAAQAAAKDAAELASSQILQAPRPTGVSGRGGGNLNNSSFWPQPAAPNLGESAYRPPEDRAADRHDGNKADTADRANRTAGRTNPPASGPAAVTGRHGVVPNRRPNQGSPTHVAAPTRNPPITRIPDATPEPTDRDDAIDEVPDSMVGEEGNSASSNTAQTGHSNTNATANDFAPSRPVTSRDTGEARDYFMDPQIEEALRDLIEQGVPVEEAEALARRENDRMLGKSLADSRARSGFAGFGLSGAAQAMDGDTRRQAADALVNDILGIQKSARDETFRNLQMASGAFDSESERQKSDKHKGMDNQIDRARLDIDADLASQQADAWRIAMIQLEEQLDMDLNDDGVIGNGIDEDEERNKPEPTDNSDPGDDAWNSAEWIDSHVDGLLDAVAPFAGVLGAVLDENMVEISDKAPGGSQYVTEYKADGVTVRVYFKDGIFHIVKVD